MEILTTMLSILSLLKYKPAIIFIVIIFILISIDIISYLSLKKIFYNNRSFRVKFIKRIYWILSLAIYALIFWGFFINNWTRDPYIYKNVYYISGYLFAFYNAKLAIITLYLLGIIISFFTDKFKGKVYRYYLSWIGFLFFWIILTFLCLGIMYGRFNFELTHSNITINDLPKEFDKLKIVQISDLHLGCYIDHENEMKKVVDLVNDQNPDLVFVTGDLVNSFSEEYKPFIPILKKIKAKYGKFAILGNHDYGDYYKWNSLDEKYKNHLQLLKYIDSSELKLLLNTNIELTKNKDQIYIAGIENWGKLPYPQYGNLTDAIKGIQPDKTVLLLSHDPYFWDHEVTKHKQIKVTFSGHTHGLQIGFRIGKIEWSPFYIILKRVKGLYEKNGQYLFVNKGIGGAFYPGRIGVRPEISLITLHNRVRK